MSKTYRFVEPLSCARARARVCVCVCVCVRARAHACLVAQSFPTLATH